MITTQPGRAAGLADVGPKYSIPGVAAMEGAYLAQILTFRAAEMWLYALEKSVKLDHDLAMATLGYAPGEHVAPWDRLSRAEGADWLAALDTGLAAAGE